MSLKYITEVTKYSSLHDLTLLSESPSRIDIKYHKDLISNYFAPKKGALKLYVFLNGAVDLKKKQPAFQRWSWSKAFDGHCLYIYDPMIYHLEDTNLCWYSGRDGYNTHSIIRKTILHFAKLLKIPNHMITLYGSSGGGFASICIGSQIADSISIAINPQIYIKNYSQRHVEKYINQAFPGKSISEFHEQYATQANAVEAINQNNPDHKVVYYQNIQDAQHYNRHTKPFAKHFNIELGAISSDGTKKVVLFDHPNGHSGETEDHVHSLIREADSLRRKPV